MFLAHVFFLELTDAMFARAGAFHGQAAPHQPFDEPLHALHFPGIVHVDEQAHVKIAIANVAENGCNESGCSNVSLCFAHAIGEA